MKPEESATTGADLLVKALIDEEVEVVFGYPGGAVLWIYDELFKQDKVKLPARKQGKKYDDHATLKGRRFVEQKY